MFRHGQTGGFVPCLLNLLNTVGKCSPNNFQFLYQSGPNNGFFTLQILPSIFPCKPSVEVKGYDYS